MAISTKKKNLMAKAKELGINVSEDMSIFDIEKAIDEASPKLKAKPQPSKIKGEY